MVIVGALTIAGASVAQTTERDEYGWPPAVRAAAEETIELTNRFEDCSLISLRLLYSGSVSPTELAIAAMENCLAEENAVYASALEIFETAASVGTQTDDFDPHAAARNYRESARASVQRIIIERVVRYRSLNAE